MSTYSPWRGSEGPPTNEARSLVMTTIQREAGYRGAEHAQRCQSQLRRHHSSGLSLDPMTSGRGSALTVGWLKDQRKRSVILEAKIRSINW